MSAAFAGVADKRGAPQPVRGSAARAPNTAKLAREAASAGMSSRFDRQPAMPTPGGETHRGITALQAVRLQQAQCMLGNRAAQRLVQRFLAGPNSSAPGGSSVRVQPDPSGRHSDARAAEPRPETPSNLGTACAPAADAATLRSPPDATRHDGDPPPLPDSPAALDHPADVAEDQADASQADTSPVSQGAPPNDPAPASAAVAAVPAGLAETPLTAGALAQQQVISTDSLRSEARVAQIGTAHRQQISGQFAGARGGIAKLLTQSSASVRGFLAGKRAELRAASAGMLRSAQALVTSTVQSAEAHAVQVKETIHSFVAGVTATLQGKMQAIAAQIGGVINTIQLPNIPGVAQLRNAAAGMVARAAAVVTGGLAQVRGLISSALQSGLQLVDSVLGNLRQLASAAVAQVSAGIQRGIQAVFQGLSQTATRITAALHSALNGAMMPMISRVEGQVTQALGTAQQQAVAAIRTNRDQHLQALAVAMSQKPGGAASAPAAARPAGDGTAALQAIGQDAVRTNHQIVQTFSERTTTILGTIFQAIVGAADRVVQQISGMITQVIGAVQARLQPVTQAISQLVEAVSTFMQSLLQVIGAALAGVTQWVRGLVQDPADQLLQFAQDTLGRITQAMSQFVRTLLSGNFSLPSIGDLIGSFTPASRGGPITKPKPPGGPITIPGLRPILIALFVFGAIVLAVAPELMVVVAALVALGIPEAVAVIILGAAVIVAIILLLLLLNLLYRLLKPAPAPPPPPPPPPCSITTKSLLPAPDGTADTRATVGANERVEMAASVPVTWRATGGAIAPASGPVAVWTAPAIVPAGGTTFSITATPASGTPCSVSMRAIPPSHRAQSNPSPIAYTAGKAGSGFVGTVTISPTSVSFSRLETREETVKSVAIGYYDTVLGWNNIAHPTGNWLPIDATNSGIQDTVGTPAPGTPGPFSAGTFTWVIPQSYREAGTGGGGAPYTPGTHQQVMAGTNGTETTSKEGASNSRTP
jgi:hypothetical protein